jgi:hypothetical protein
MEMYTGFNGFLYRSGYFLPLRGFFRLFYGLYRRLGGLLPLDERTQVEREREKETLLL